jgi:hypothetical protein
LLHDYVYTIPTVKGRLLLSFISAEGRLLGLRPLDYGLLERRPWNTFGVWGYCFARGSITSVCTRCKEFIARSWCWEDILILETDGGLDTDV